MSPERPQRGTCRHPEPADVRYYGDPDIGGPPIRLRTTNAGQHLEVFRSRVGWESAPERLRDILNGNIQEIDAATAERIRLAKDRRPGSSPAAGGGP